MRREERRQKFKDALQVELKEHKSSFLVFTVLRILVVLSMIRQLFLGNYQGFVLCIVSFGLLYLPAVFQLKLKIELPPALEISVLVFIFASEVLGEINAFYIKIPIWDALLHALNGFLCAAIGFSLVTLLNSNEKLKFQLSPVFMALTAFCFSMTIGVFWEFVECGMDYFFGFDMQKDTVIHQISSVLLNGSDANQPIQILNIKEVLVNGKSLGIDGYLDIGLLDTMKDLFVNFIGALVFSVFGYFYSKTKGKQEIAKKFIPKEKDPGRDYLEQAKHGELPDK